MGSTRHVRTESDGVSTGLLVGGCCCWGAAECGGWRVHGVIIDVSAPYILCPDKHDCEQPVVDWVNSGPMWVPMQNAPCYRLIVKNFDCGEYSVRLWVQLVTNAQLLNLLNVSMTLFGGIHSLASYFTTTWNPASLNTVMSAQYSGSGYCSNPPVSVSSSGSATIVGEEL